MTCLLLFSSLISSLGTGAAAELSREKNPALSPSSPEEVQQVFLKGKAYYDAGDLDTALKTWQTLDPYLEAYPSIRKVVDYLKKRGPASAEEPQPDFSLTLEKAAETMGKRRDDARKAQEALSGKGRTEWVRDAFEKGRSAFEEGDWATAIEHWEKMASYLDESSPERQTIEALKRDYFSSEKLRAETSRQLAEAKAKIPAPAGLKELLDEVKTKLRAEAASAGSQAEAAAKARSDREAWVDATLVRARSAYEEGRIEPAIAEWEKALPYLENENELREKIRGLRDSLRNLSDARAQSDDASEAFKRLKMPFADRMTAEIARAADILRAREGRAIEKQNDVKKSLAEREEWINTQFENGRELMSQGRMLDALSQWEPILPNVERGEELRGEFERLRSLDKQAQAVEQKVSDEGKEPRLKAPVEMEELLGRISKELTSKRDEAESRRKESEAAALEQQKIIAQEFEAGRQFYVQGKYWEAAEAWKRMIPMVQEAPQLEKWIGQFEREYKHYLDSKSAADRLQSERNARFAAPADVLKLLSQAQNDVEAQTAALVAERAALEKGKTEHESWVKDVFQKGKTLYQQERPDLALVEWEKLLPHLDESSPERALILEMRKLSDQADQARSSIKDLSASAKNKVGAPTDLKLAVEAAIDATRAKQREAEMEQKAIERSIQERRNTMLEILQNGKDAFDSGRPKDALSEWKQLLQYVDARSQIDESLKSFEDALTRHAETKQKLAESQSRGGVLFEPPQELSAAIQQAAERISAQAAKAHTEQSQIDAEAASRRLWLDQTYQAGKQHYAAGRLEEAVDEWTKLGPYLTQESGMAARLAELKGLREEAARAKKDAVEAAARQYKGLRIDPQMELFIAEVSKDLKTQMIQNQKDLTRAEETLAANQKKVEKIFAEGKALYDGGDPGAAVTSWSAMAPYLDENSPARRQLTSMKQVYDESQKLRTAAEKAQADATAAVALPSDFPKLMEEAARRLASQREAAQAQVDRSKLARSEREKKAAALYQSAKARLWENDLPGSVAEFRKLAAEAPDTEAAVQALETDLSQTVKAKAAADAATARAQEKLAPPADFAKETEAARQKIRAQIDALLAQKSQAETSQIARQTSLQQAFERGKAEYWAGRVPEALKIWQPVADSISDEEAVKAYAELLKAHARLLEAQKSAADAADSAAGKLAAPTEISKLLALALEKTNAQIAAAHAEKDKMAADRAARMARAAEAYQKGASAAAAGKYAEAVAEWRELQPLVDPQQGIEPALDALEKALSEASAAMKATDDYASGEFKDIQFRHADEIKKLVSQSETVLKAQAAAAQKRKAEMEKTIADRRAWVEATYQKGKALFEAGRFVEAFEFWKSLVPYLVDGPETVQMLAEFEKLQAETAAAVADAVEAESKKDARFPMPSDFPALMAGATEKIKAALFEARTRREQAEQVLSDRRVALQKAFDAGKAAYEKGSTPGALEEWAKMLPSVENEEAVRAALDELRAAHQASIQAMKDATEAEQRKNARLAIPAALKTTLASVSERMKKETEAAVLVREKMEKALSDRKAFVADLYSRGKALYDEGKLREAFDLWKTIGPYVEEEQLLLEHLSKAGQAYESFVAAKSASHEAVLKQSMKQTTPPELAAAIDSAIDSLKQEDFDLRNKTFEIEKGIADRREWINSTFKKGQALYLERRYPEAVAEWNTIVPYLVEGIDVKAKLVEIEKNAVLAEKARQVLAQSQENAKLQFLSPKEMSELLLKANEDLKNEMFAASAEKMKAEQTFAERQKWMNSTFELGRSYYAEGKVVEALAEWSKLKPYLDGQPAIEEMMGMLQKNVEELQKLRKEAVEATAEDYKGMKLVYSDQMAKVLENAVKKIGDETLALNEKLDKTHATLTERKEWSLTTFNKGKVFYEDGRYKEALEQWERLLPYLEDNAEVKVLIESYKKGYTEWADRSGAIGDLQKRTEKPVQLAQPEAMAVVLRDAADKMKAQAAAAEARAGDLEKQLTGRREWIEYTYGRGKTLFDEGRYAEAVNEWGVLGPYLAEHPDVRAEIEEAKRSYIQFRKADQILKNTETKIETLPALPKDAVVPPPVPATEDAGMAPPPSAETPAVEKELPPAGKVTEDELEAEPKPSSQAAELKLVSGEIVSVDRSTSTLYLRQIDDNSEKIIRFDGATEFDGEGAAADSLDKGLSVDARVDAQGRASYIYIY